MIPYGRHNINRDDVEAVVRVLRSNFLTQGPTVEDFEQKISEYCGVKHAVAVSNATSALHIACLSIGLKSGDLAWTTPNTFVATANCARYCGADVDFVDIDPSTWNLSSERLSEKLKRAQSIGRLPKVLLPVHFSGQSCDMEAIGALARQYGVEIIEDASHAIGAKFSGEAVGACVHSKCTVFSFHPVKIITTGEGGVVTTNDSALAARLRLLRSHGITRDTQLMTEANPGPWHYEQIELGFNYRMTDIQAALGISQMLRLDEFTRQRRDLAARYQTLLADLPLQLPTLDYRAESSWHLYVVRLNNDVSRISHRALFERIREAGIGVNLHYTPVHLQPYYRALGFAPGYCPEAEDYYGEAITLPLYPDLSENEQDYIAATIRNLLT